MNPFHRQFLKAVKRNLQADRQKQIDDAFRRFWNVWYGKNHGDMEPEDMAMLIENTKRILKR